MILLEDPAVAPAQAVAAAKAYLRVEHNGEDGLIGRLIGTALTLCGGFIGERPMQGAVKETLGVAAGWQRLGAAPVAAITEVQGLGPDGAAFALPVDAYQIDIDRFGHGWVRMTAAIGASRVLVTYQAGLAADWEGLPEPLRQGVVRLAAHLFAHRDRADDRGPPAAVAALWRPWRRMRLQ